VAWAPAASPALQFAQVAQVAQRAPMTVRRAVAG